jgi:hypothetical protein
MAAKRPPQYAGVALMPPSKWKRSRNALGLEVFNYPSTLAQQLWLYPRAVGKSDTPPSFRMDHRDEDGYVLHMVSRGRLWHRIRARTHVAGPAQACLMDISHDISYGNDGEESARFYWVLFNGRDMPQIFTELRADQEPVFGPLDVARIESLFRELMAITNRPPPAYEPKASALHGGAHSQAPPRFPERGVGSRD